MSGRFMSSVALTALLALTTTSAFAAKSAEEFIKDAIQGDNSEVMLGQLAQDKAGSQKVREFGQMLVTDHSRAKEEASSVAKTLGVTPPDQPTTRAQDEQTKLSKLSGDGFDKEFASYMVTDHEKNINEFQDQANAKQGPTSDMAAKQLPTLQNHLAMAQAIAQKGDAAPSAMSKAANKETADEWRASKLPGVTIYGPDNKKVGTITDVMMSKEGKAEFIGLGSKQFFDALLTITMEGFFSDPIYGGNHDMVSWKMIGYPGLPAAYREDIKKYFGKKYDKPPRSIADFS